MQGGALGPFDAPSAMGLQDYKGCSEEFINGLEYSQVAGLIIGMIALGFSIDRIGRRLGSILTASVMLIGEAPSAPVTAADALIGGWRRIQAWWYTCTELYIARHTLHVHGCSMSRGLSANPSAAHRAVKPHASPQMLFSCC